MGAPRRCSIRSCEARRARQLRAALRVRYTAASRTCLLRLASLDMDVRLAPLARCALVALLSLHMSVADARPKVCLVLSGGGARGAAHIGVIKVLEMEALINTLSTEALFKERPPRQDQAIRRKLDDRSILFGIEVGLRDGELLLPKGVVSGVQLETVLRRLTKAHGYRRFDELPVAYRAVATDLVTGKAVVFSEGELANVMRASMSVPAAIAPAELDGKILVDGGLTDNLPVDVARAMGAEVVIAVNLGTPLMKREELTSIVGVTGQ